MPTRKRLRLAFVQQSLAVKTPRSVLVAAAKKSSRLSRMSQKSQSDVIGWL